MFLYSRLAGSEENLHANTLLSEKKKTVLNVNLWCTEYIDILYM